jgi:hypothetical protein
MIGGGGDKAARQDLFPTQVTEWQTEERVGSPPIGTGSSFDLVSHPVSEHLRALGRLRAEHPALSTGGTFVRVAREGLLAVSRIDAQARREYLAVFNAGEMPASVTIQTATPSAAWAQLLGPAVSATTAANGRATITVPALSALLFRAEPELPRRGAPRLTLRAAADLFTNQTRLTATPATVDPLSVTFAVRRARASSWSRIAADDGAPYRAYLDPRAYRRGERVSVVAVARGSDGTISTSSVLTLTPRR